MSDHKLWIGMACDAYIVPIGQVIVQWAYFETEFETLLSVLRYNPEAKALCEEIPGSFKKRLRLFKDSFEMCFKECGSLNRRFSHIHSEASRLSKIRNVVAHSRWSGDQENGHLFASLYTNKKIQDHKITTETLDKTAVDISAISRHVMAILACGIPSQDYSFPLEQDELSALRAFRRRNYPNLPIPNIDLLRSSS